MARAAFTAPTQFHFYRLLADCPENILRFFGTYYSIQDSEYRNAYDLFRRIQTDEAPLMKLSPINRILLYRDLGIACKAAGENELARQSIGAALTLAREYNFLDQLKKIGTVLNKWQFAIN